MFLQINGELVYDKRMSLKAMSLQRRGSITYTMYIVGSLFCDYLYNNKNDDADHHYYYDNAVAAASFVPALNVSISPFQSMRYNRFCYLSLLYCGIFSTHFFPLSVAVHLLLPSGFLKIQFIAAM